MMRRGLSLVCGLWLIGCGGNKTVAATEVLVKVDSDIAVPSALARVEIEVLSPAGARVDQHTFKLVSDSPSSGEFVLPFTLGINKRSSNTFQLVVNGYGPDAASGDSPLVQYRANVSFRDRATLKLTAFLTQLCSAASCDDNQTCYPAADGGTDAGACGSIPQIDRDTAPVDAGTSAPDAGSTSPDAGEAPAGAGGSRGAAGGGAGGRGAAGHAGAASGCKPSCDGKQCGDDGCGAQCGSCKSNETCQNDSCVCKPSCSGKTCGDDGCGGQCGSCKSNEQCVGNACVCTPDCSGKKCGADGCGGTCAPGCNAAVGGVCSDDGTCKLSCGATSTFCNCDTPPSSSAAPGDIYPEPLCVSGMAVFNGCTDTSGNASLCYVSGTAVGYQWGETCDCTP